MIFSDLLTIVLLVQVETLLAQYEHPFADTQGNPGDVLYGEHKDFPSYDNYGPQEHILNYPIHDALVEEHLDDASAVARPGEPPHPENIGVVSGQGPAETKPMNVAEGQRTDAVHPEASLKPPSEVAEEARKAVLVPTLGEGSNYASKHGDVHQGASLMEIPKSEDVHGVKGNIGAPTDMREMAQHAGGQVIGTMIHEPNSVPSARNTGVGIPPGSGIGPLEGHGEEQIEPDIFGNNKRNTVARAEATVAPSKLIEEFTRTATTITEQAVVQELTTKISTQDSNVQNAANLATDVTQKPDGQVPARKSDIPVGNVPSQNQPKPKETDVKKGLQPDRSGSALSVKAPTEVKLAENQTETPRESRKRGVKSKGKEQKEGKTMVNKQKAKVKKPKLEQPTDEYEEYEEDDDEGYESEEEEGEDDNEDGDEDEVESVESKKPQGDHPELHDDPRVHRRSLYPSGFFSQSVETFENYPTMNSEEESASSDVLDTMQDLVEEMEIPSEDEESLQGLFFAYNSDIGMEDYSFDSAPIQTIDRQPIPNSYVQSRPQVELYFNPRDPLTRREGQDYDTKMNDNIDTSFYDDVLYDVSDENISKNPLGHMNKYFEMDSSDEFQDINLTSGYEESSEEDGMYQDDIEDESER